MPLIRVFICRARGVLYIPWGNRVFIRPVAVVGATGKQGGNVIKALAESDKPYRIRAFTRDATKPAAKALAKIGVEVVTVSLVVTNREQVFEAFSGADVAFHLDSERETAEGKLLIDAAKAGGVSRIVWSGIQSVTEASGGKYTCVYHWDSKAAISEYGRSSGCGFYGSNFLGMNAIMLAKQGDGSFAIRWPTKPSTVLPFIDTVYDYGLFVRQVLEQPVFPDGSEVRTSNENITVEDVALQLSRGTGKQVVFKQISVEEFKANIKSLGFPPHIIIDLVEHFLNYDEFGYYAGRATASHAGLTRAPRTFAEFVQATDWSPVFG
ncbi:NAD(P)-binding protein [Mycena rosella]|uniref:NAD(P)-binding protein n=1 Tax=Mycena rosella TaxID=1033263 RepID=A0AAD7G3U9_MYCRO|nr:NAD(P)-binding protein [Mycena rosella]